MTHDIYIYLTIYIEVIFGHTLFLLFADIQSTKTKIQIPHVRDICSYNLTVHAQVNIHIASWPRLVGWPGHKKCSQGAALPRGKHTRSSSAKGIEWLEHVGAVMH